MLSGLLMIYYGSFSSEISVMQCNPPLECIRNVKGARKPSDRFEHPIRQNWQGSQMSIIRNWCGQIWILATFDNLAERMSWKEGTWQFEGRSSIYQKGAKLFLCILFTLSPLFLIWRRGKAWFTLFLFLTPEYHNLTLTLERENQIGQ